MEVQPSEIVIAVQTMQCLAALVLGWLLWHFHRTFQHVFLRHWAFSVFALAVYLAASAGALGAVQSGADQAVLRLVLSAVSLTVAYPHVAWLMIGTWEASRQMTVPRRLEYWLVGSVAAAGLASALVMPFDPDAAWLRALVRIDLRYVLTGTAFVVAGVLLWRSQRHTGLLGARIGSIGFGLFGLQLLHVAGISTANLVGAAPPFYTPYIGLLDFLCQTIIGLGIVVWLLELQQRRARRVHSELEHVRSHDPGTGLPNRDLLIRQLDEVIGRTGARRVAVISLGMNRYARLNRALGWNRTERVMRKVSARLHEAINQRCILGRIGDRDFVVARPTLEDVESIREWTERLLGTLVQPLELEDREIFVTFCAGVAVYPDDARDPESLLHYSQHALVQSAQIGRDVTLYQHLDRRASDDVETALVFESELRRGLAERQFDLHFQPIVRVDDRRPAGYEALLRWHHPRRGVLRPERFLDEAASIGILDELESFALARALEQLARWRRAGHTALCMAVNVSARRFQHPELVEQLAAECRRFGVPPARLELEITENTALRDLPAAASRIEALHAVGITVALDDFGTGYSSLANLVKLPVDRVKLDREFLKNVPDERRQSQLVAAIIALAHRLELEVVAEGVEQEAQFEFLARTTCDLAQGYLIKRPAAADQCGLDSEPVA